MTAGDAIVARTRITVGIGTVGLGGVAGGAALVVDHAAEGKNCPRKSGELQFSTGRPERTA